MPPPLLQLSNAGARAAVPALPERPPASYASPMADRFRPRADPRGARTRVLRSGPPRRLPRDPPALPQRPLGRAASASTASTTPTGSRHFGRFEPLPGSLPEPLALRYHGHQFRAYNPDLGDGRGFLYAQAPRPRRRPPARPRHQGLRPDPLVARRRRPADAEGRRARDPRHRDARGARRLHLQDLLADRDRRGADPRRRALADPLRRCSSASATATSASAASSASPPSARPPKSAASSSIRSPTTGPTPPRRPTRSPRFYDRVVGAVAGLGAEWFAAGFVHGVLNTDNVNDHRRELRLRPLALPRPLRPGLHRRLLRPDRPLRLRPPARGAELEPRPPRRMPDPALLPRRDRAAVRQLRRPLPGRARPARPSPASASSPATTRRRARADAPLLGRDAGDRAAVPAGLPRPARRRRRPSACAPAPLRAALRDRRPGPR